MKWSYREPTFGDMIRVAVGGIYHFGIYVSDEEVIQFGLPPNMRAGLRDADVEVIAADIDAFLAGGFLEVCDFDKKEKKKNRTPEETVRYARSKLGMRGYHILYNNCEHFANECVTGVQICRQAEDVRALFRNMPVVDVYLAALPKELAAAPLACQARQAEIDAVSNERVKREKHFAWKLLVYALERSFGMREERLHFTKEAYGGWSVEGAEFSLSHCDGMLAVAVSRARVGVDVERVAPRAENLAARVMTKEEFAQFAALSDEQKELRFAEIWTAKEAIFKSRKQKFFLPIDCDTLSASVKTDSFVANGVRYAWSVATDTPERVRVFSDIDLT